ncbi:SemiSWEET family transporter [Streptococcus massiliensis]|uniref:Integral membrane protein n=1 Tax=Streptococcus massiliensis TaxID=313439 RepID=A0A380KXM0_9STRE|nr:SemiSWEET family transporter [Streptococcus massiliensis]SUN76703.1 integral membrane protein [Streptococcus massiliensis]
MKEKHMIILGWVATFMSVMMYVSYIPQIMDNLSGSKGNFVQPLVAAINCSLWVYYGLFKKERDIPLAAANMPGIVFGLITAITALM